MKEYKTIEEVNKAAHDRVSEIYEEQKAAKFKMSEDAKKAKSKLDKSGKKIVDMIETGKEMESIEQSEKMNDKEVKEAIPRPSESDPVIRRKK